MVKTVVLGTEAFRYFLEHRCLPEEQIVRTIELCTSLSFDGKPLFFVWHSSLGDSPGLLEATKVPIDPTTFKGHIEMLYGSWLHGKARNLRIARNISDQESFPAVFIQPFFENVVSLCTRVPKTGDPTDSGNWEGNIHNSVERYDPCFTDCLIRVERCLGFPQKVFLVNEGNRPICSVTEQPMTNTIRARRQEEQRTPIMGAWARQCESQKRKRSRNEGTEYPEFEAAARWTAIPAKNSTMGTVLWVDDDPFSSRMGAAILNDELGYGVRIAESASEAPDIALSEKIAAVILDMMMEPGPHLSYIETHGGVRTGLALARRISPQKPDLPIIAFTGNPSGEVYE